MKKQGNLFIKPPTRKKRQARPRQHKPDVTPTVNGVPGLGSTIWSFVPPNDREYEILIKQLSEIER
jgi:hypothetical protein